VRQGRNQKQISDYSEIPQAFDSTGFGFLAAPKSMAALEMTGWIQKERLRFDDQEIAEHQHVDAGAVETADGVAHIAHQRLSEKIERGIEQDGRR
jgi:hypothetical protein